MKLSKISIPYRAGQKLIGLLAFMLFVGSGSLAAASAMVVIVYLGILTLLLAAVAGYEYLYWKNFEFRVERDGLKIVSGVISKNDRDIPLKRIQNVAINRNIVQRLLGIAKADIETAGGGSTEASLKYVDYEDAQQLQQRVRELKNRRKSDTEQEGERKEREDFVLSDRDLVLLSLTSMDMKILGGLALLFSMFGGSVSSQLGTAGLAVTSILGVLVVAGVWIASAASTFIRFYDFRLQFHENALEYERGLLNRASGTIPEEKIQDIIIEENFVQRYLRFASLEVETAGYSQKQGEVDTGSETVIPLANRSRVEKFASELGGYTEPDFDLVHPKARSRYFRRYLMVGAVLGAIAFGISNLFDVTLLVYLPAAIVLLGSKKAAQLKWENIGYYLDEKRIFTRKGFWNRKTYVIPYFRVQNLMQTQTVFQRHWSQSTLLLDTAGSVVSFPQIVDLDHERASVLREELFDCFKRSLRR